MMPQSCEALRLVLTSVLTATPILSALHFPPMKLQPQVVPQLLQIWTPTATPKLSSLSPIALRLPEQQVWSYFLSPTASAFRQACFLPPLVHRRKCQADF
uniref:Secreted protein n=1 Tax=Arundo donax TaxID=35708 RepID=A0A0A9CWQ5_ARUDO